MPRILIAGRAVPLSPARSILVTLQLAGVPIETRCGGRALCGRCAIRVLSGAQMLSPPRERELQRLKAIGASPDMRLACQTHARGDVEIDIVNVPPETSRAAENP